MRTILALLMLSVAALADETLPHDQEWTCHQIMSAHIDAGSGYVPGTYRNVEMVGGNGSAARADLTVGPHGTVDDVRMLPGQDYAIGDRLTAELPGGSGFALTVETLTDFHPAMLRRDVRSRQRAEMQGRNPCFTRKKVSEPPK